MAIDDHESPFKELLLKNRRATGDGGPEEEEEEEEAAAAAAHGEQWPPWLRPLLSARFYTQCKAHPYSRRGGERTMFCLDCAGAGALCGLCLGHGHRGHRAIQIRRSTYSSVIRVSDIRGLVDVGGVQTYVINGARVVFLNERSPQYKHSGGAKGGGANLCEACGRGLHDVFRFCSLGCKVAGCSHDGNTSSSSPLRNAVNQSSTPPPPPPTPPAKRRKGIPRRAPFGSLIIDY